MRKTWYCDDYISSKVKIEKFESVVGRVYYGGKRGKLVYRAG